MEINYDVELKKIIDNKFDFLDLIPTAMSIIDLDSRVLVKYNGVLKNILKLEDDEIYDLDKIIYSMDCDFNIFLEEDLKADSFFVVIQTKDELLVSLISNAKKYVVDGRNFVLCSHVNILENLLPENIYVERHSYPEENGKLPLENILNILPVFTCILTEDKKEVVYANNTCKRYFGADIENRQTSDIFYDIEELDSLNNSTMFNIEFESIIGSK